MNHLAIIGSGASAIYLLKHLLDHTDRAGFQSVTIFEKSRSIGVGMPYSPETTDRYNLSNISSEELPDLPVTFVDWLQKQDEDDLREVGVDPETIDAKSVYSRLALGRYLHAQYRELIAQLEATGVSVVERPGCRIDDLRDGDGGGRVTLVTEDGEEVGADCVVIATGHSWPAEDQPEHGFYASPWPIFKLLPADSEFLEFPVATLGASLSAFDVVSSLAHRHGTFHRRSGRLEFRPHPGAERFRISMHSAEGLLPHLQFEQDEPLREIYRHVDREGILVLVNEAGYLRLETYFDEVCRPALRKAFRRDQRAELVDLLGDPTFGLKDFVEKMTADHDYRDPFEGMRGELEEARLAVENDRPYRWKEVLDDLTYTLNFHTELLPAEDQLVFRGDWLPFVMNVIAALPLPSAEILLALHDLGRLELVEGRAEIAGKGNGVTTVSIEKGEDRGSIRYQMLVDCRGQKPVGLEDFPFNSLVKGGAIRAARALFLDPARRRDVPEEKRDLLCDTPEGPAWQTGGIDIDTAYRILGAEGAVHRRIHDIALPHTAGMRPYSYGLQACSATSEIVVRSWVEGDENFTLGPELYKSI